MCCMYVQMCASGAWCAYVWRTRVQVSAWGRGMRGACTYRCIGLWSTYVHTYMRAHQGHSWCTPAHGLACAAASIVGCRSVNLCPEGDSAQEGSSLGPCLGRASCSQTAAAQPAPLLAGGPVLALVDKHSTARGRTDFPGALPSPGSAPSRRCSQQRALSQQPVTCLPLLPRQSQGPQGLFCQQPMGGSTRQLRLLSLGCSRDAGRCGFRGGVESLPACGMPGFCRCF